MADIQGKLAAFALVGVNREVGGAEVHGSAVTSIAVSGGLEWNIMRKDWQGLLAAQRTVSGRNTDDVQTIAATVVWTF